MRGRWWQCALTLLLIASVAPVWGAGAQTQQGDDLAWPDLTQLTLHPEDLDDPDYRSDSGLLHTAASAADWFTGGDPDLAGEVADILDRFGFVGMYTHRMGRLRADDSGLFEEYIETFALDVEDGPGAFAAFQAWGEEVLGADLEPLPIERSYADESAFYRVRGATGANEPFVQVGVDLRRSHLLAGFVVVNFTDEEPSRTWLEDFAAQFVRRINSNEGAIGRGATVLRLDGAAFADRNDLLISFGDTIPMVFEAPEETARRQAFSDLVQLEQAHYFWQRSVSTDGDDGFADYFVYAFQSTSEARVEANRNRIRQGTLSGDDQYRDVEPLDQPGLFRITFVYDDGSTHEGYRADLFDGSSFVTMEMVGSPIPSLDGFLALVEAQTDCLEASDGCPERFSVPDDLFAGMPGEHGTTRHESTVPGAPTPSQNDDANALRSTTVAFARGNLARTGELPGTGPAVAPVLLWQTDLGSSSPAGANLALAAGTLFLATLDGNVQAIDAATGGVRWRTSIGVDAPTDPAVVDGVVYVGSMIGVTALDASSGEVLWTTAIGGQVTSSPAVVDGLVIVGAFGDEPGVYALAFDSGEVRWRYATGDPVAHALAVADGVVFGASWGGEVFALDAATGMPLWSIDVDGMQGQGMVAVGGVALLFAADVIANVGLVVALDAASGEERWHHSTGAFQPESVVMDGVVWLRADGVVTLDLATGAVVDVSDPIAVAGMTGADGVLYLATGGLNRSDPGDDVLIAADPASLLLRWSTETPLGLRGAPLVADGVVYLCGDGVIYALAAPQ